MFPDFSKNIFFLIKLHLSPLKWGTRPLIFKNSPKGNYFEVLLAWPMLDNVMMHKQTVALHKPWLNTAATGLHLSGILARLRNVVRIQIPIGYQDEAGFHTGAKSAQKEIHWPSVW